MERSAARLIAEAAAVARIAEIGGTMAAHVSAPSTVWALGDYHRFAKEMVWKVGPELVAACGIGPGQRVLDVAAGTGNVAIRAAEAGADVVASDVTPESLAAGELEARTLGVELEWVVADAQELPFADGEFDVSVANWMLYHVPDLDRGLAELARVLRPGGRLVATTNSLDHLGELWSLVGRDRRREPVRFFSETAEEPLLRHFARVERYDNEGTVVFEDRAAVQRYVASSVAHKHLVDQVPPLDGPLVANTNNSVFVAEKA
jgi:2-polyprenyl-3-methyl-5-hydroxy-6-metoxy-1,4-benzoquinol methylase